MNSYYELPLNIREEIKELLATFDISNLYLKAAYNGDYQLINLIGENVSLIIKQERLYKDRLSYKTNCVGDITLVINYLDSEIKYKLDELLYILSWIFDDYIFRMIVPSSLLSNEIIKQFTVKIIESNLPTISNDTEQFIYYNDLDGGEILLTMFPQIIIENKGGIE